MKKNDVRWMGLTFLAVALWCCSVFLAGKVETMSHSVSARWLEDGISPSLLVKQEEFLKKDGAKNIPEVTLWKENPYQEVYGEYEHTVTSMVITLFGHVEDVCGEGMFLGGYPIKGDDRGCIISEQTAFEIWGSRDVLGKTLHWNQKSYYVYGVMKGEDGFVILQVDESSTQTFSNMQIRFLDGGTREKAETYLKRMGFLKDDIENLRILDFPLISWFLKLICFFPALLLGFRIFIKILRQGMKLRNFPRLFLLYMPIAGSMLGVLYMIMKNSLGGVPAQLIPTSWSNFDFMGNLAEEYSKHIKDWLTFPTGRDVTLCLTVFSAILTILITVVFLVASLNSIRMYSLRKCLVWCFGLMTICFLMAMILATHGGIRMNMAMWWMPSLWMITDYGFYLFKRYLNPNKIEQIASISVDGREVL